LNCYRIVKWNWRKRLTRHTKRVWSPVSAVLRMLKRMDIVLPVYRQLLKRHKYPIMELGNPNTLLETGGNRVSGTCMRMWEQDATRSKRQAVTVWIGVQNLP